MSEELIQGLRSMMQANSGNDKHIKLGVAVKILSYSFILMLLSYFLVYAFGQGTTLVYLVVPFVLMFWGSCIYLTWLVYSKFMAVICVLSILFPPAVFLIGLVSYFKAAAYVKERGWKLGLMGNLSAL